MPDPRPIVVVDDDTDLRALVGELLEDEGHDARLFENGREALEFLRRGERPKLILLDLMMPEMNGWEFRARQLDDAALRDIPVVVLTASQSLDDRPIAAQEILYKPVEIGELLGAVERNAR
jgi:CheY-like chemotaxis protein